MEKLTPEELERLRNVEVTQICTMFTNLRQIGDKYKAQCPFHNDRTPSFFIYPDNSYHCYGCGRHGNNAIDFFVDMGYEFEDALVELVKYI